MGSDWVWELRTPEAVNEPALRHVYRIAARHDFHPQRPDGLINVFSAGGWPAELGWWTYLAPDPSRPAAPLAEIDARTRRLPDGALLIQLLDDPAAVDVLSYEELHQRWLRSP